MDGDSEGTQNLETMDLDEVKKMEEYLTMQ